MNASSLLVSFYTFQSSKSSNGFDYTILQCQAIAAAIFGRDDAKDRVEAVYMPESDERFIALQNETVDLSAARIALTMERDVYEVNIVELWASVTGFVAI